MLIAPSSLHLLKGLQTGKRRGSRESECVGKPRRRMDYLNIAQGETYFLAPALALSR